MALNTCLTTSTGFTLGSVSWANKVLVQHCRLSINGRSGGSVFDELGCFLRVRHVGHVAGIHFDRLGVGPFRHHALLVRVDRAVGAGHHVPSGLGLPGRRRDLVGERVGRDRHLRLGHEVGHGRRDVRREIGREML